MVNQNERIRKIKKKYGADAFVKFGKKGGSPVLRDWKAGRLVRRR